LKFTRIIGPQGVKGVITFLNISTKYGYSVTCQSVTPLPPIDLNDQISDKLPV